MKPKVSKNEPFLAIILDPEKRIDIFKKMDPADQVQACLTLNKYIVYGLLSSLTDEKLAALIEYAEPDEATDILQLFAKEKQKRLLDQVGQETREALKTLLNFDPESAAGIMNPDFIQVDEMESIAEVSRRFKSHEKRTGRPPAIIAIKQKGDKKILAGYLPGHDLGFARPRDKVKKFIRKISSIPSQATHDDVIALFHNRPNTKVAVLGNKGQIMGIIYSDDILRLLKERESMSLYDFAGVSKEESVFDSAASKIKFRYKWLIINLATSFLASFTVGIFNDEISKYVILAIYMPIIAGMGGNAGTQAMAVIVRGITLKQIENGSIAKILKNEIISGFVNGIINGFIVAAISYIAHRDPLFSAILFSAMAVNLVIAAAAGTLIPLVMHRLGKDPASSATIFITTATDVLGFLAFLGLASIILP